MRQRRWGTIGLAAVCAVLLSEPTAVQTLTANDLFNDQVLHEIRLSIHSKDLAELRERYQENVYFPADLTWRGQRVRNVGMRSRGGGSRSRSKLGLKIDFDRYTTGQRFLGMRSLVLDNMWQDAALMREFLAMALYRRIGEAAPRESFARLYINNEYQGLYAIVEDVTNEFVTRAVGDTGGYLYEYHWLRNFYMDDPGDDLNVYKPMFEPRNHELESDSALYGPIRDLFREINGPDDAVWRQRVGDRIDLAEFMTHVGVQGFLANNDGILGNFGINNFYLYRFNNSTRHRLIPWDEDQAFEFVDITIKRQGSQDVVLFQRALAYDDLKGIFLDAAQRCAERALEDNWFANEIERVAALIDASVREDRQKQFDDVAFDAKVEFLREVAARRPQIVLDEVAGLRTPGVISPPDPLVPGLLQQQ
jgi:spore coat protein CotH